MRTVHDDRFALNKGLRPVCFPPFCGVDNVRPGNEGMWALSRDYT